MEAVTIHDMGRLGDGHLLAVDLVDLVRLFEPEVRELSWTCRYVECVGNAAYELYRAAETGAALDGADLLRLASGVDQVIDGEFIGTPVGGARPRLVIVAEDSTYYVVASAEPGLLDRVRQRFSDVRPSPEYAEEYGGPTSK